MKLKILSNLEDEISARDKKIENLLKINRDLEKIIQNLEYNAQKNNRLSTEVDKTAGTSANDLKKKLYTIIKSKNLSSMEKELDTQISKTCRKPDSHDLKNLHQNI